MDLASIGSSTLHYKRLFGSVAAHAVWSGHARHAICSGFESIYKTRETHSRQAPPQLLRVAMFQLESAKKEGYPTPL